MATRLRTRRLAVLGVAVMLVAAACGDDDDDSADSATTAASGTETTAAGATPSSGTNDTGGADGTVTTVSFNAADNTASDVGITPTEITIGNVVTLTGPVPGLFAGSQAGTKAYFEYINEQGGVYGRKLVLKEGDDALDCNTNQTVHEGMLDSVFAFVGSFTVTDASAANVLAANPTVPDVHYQLSAEANDATKVPNSFSPQPQPPGFRTGPYNYYKATYPDAVTKVGILHVNNSPTTYANQKAAMESVGFKIIYDREFAPTEVDFTADVVRMKDAGVEYLDLRNAALPQIAPILSAAAQQGWKPQVMMTNATYDKNLFDLLADPSAADGLVMDQQYAMFLGEDAATTPVVQTFLDYMKKVAPDQAVDLFAAYSWASADLFVDALTAAGQNPTRADVLAALGNIHEFDGDGMVATADPGAHKPPECWMLVTIKDQGFERTLPEGTGFSCEYTGYFLKT